MAVAFFRGSSNLIKLLILYWMLRLGQLIMIIVLMKKSYKPPQIASQEVVFVKILTHRQLCLEKLR